MLLFPVVTQSAIMKLRLITMKMKPRPAKQAACEERRSIDGYTYSLGKVFFKSPCLLLWGRSGGLLGLSKAEKDLLQSTVPFTAHGILSLKPNEFPFTAKQGHQQYSLSITCLVGKCTVDIILDSYCYPSQSILSLYTAHG